MKKENYTWKQFDRDIVKLAKIVKKYKPKNIYGVPRGGLVIAVCLSYRLDIPLVNMKGIRKETVIVDDIFDTGKTISDVISRIGAFYSFEIPIITLFKNISSGINIGNHEYIHETRNWIIFPWETRKSSKIDKTIK